MKFYHKDLNFTEFQSKILNSDSDYDCPSTTPLNGDTVLVVHTKADTPKPVIMLDLNGNEFKTNFFTFEPNTGAYRSCSALLYGQMFILGGGTENITRQVTFFWRVWLFLEKSNFPKKLVFNNYPRYPWCGIVGWDVLEIYQWILNTALVLRLPTQRNSTRS